MASLSINTPVGHLSLIEDQDALVAVEWGAVANSDDSTLLLETKTQLNAYFDGRLTEFDLPLSPSGTAFQQQVWAEMRKIPYGKLRTYGDLAVAIGSSPRPVGGACGRNPIPIILPCHRVVGNDGEMAGYSGGRGVLTKQQLLRLEGVKRAQLSFQEL
ncbi:MAG: Methylated-DNA--protein-cysteine methyltransferase, constitutive [Alphaproteobacteria bacterium MarineAlpha3_Bin4]|nr:MAG: Methylated-DNA--protein-cysteine methyltransferase, constitutive [Alphaproteobacteria bacterium MarineAlpha3_Bin4]